MQYESFGKYLLRKPLYSYDILFENLVTKDLNKTVKELITDANFVSSIYWSSPKLYELIDAYKNNSLDDFKTSKLINTLKKYAIRIATRATPYGTMAGVVLKDILENNEETYIKRKARIDMGFLADIKNSIEADHQIRKNLFYRVNNTLSEIAGQYRYHEPRNDIEEKYQLSSLEITEPLTKLSEVLEYTSYTKIFNLYKDEFENEEIHDFLNELISNSFLVSELQFKVTEDNTVNYINILERLKEEDIPEADLFLDIFLKIVECIKIIEQTDISYIPLEEINTIKLLSKSVGIESNQIFHVDLIHNSEQTFCLDKKLLNEINYAVSALSNFKTNNAFQDNLDHFKKLFQIKYESAEILLTEALDEELGIGFPSLFGIGNLNSNSLLEGKSNKQRKQHNSDTNSSIDFLINLIEEDNTKSIQLENHPDFISKQFSINSEDVCIVGIPYGKNFFIQNISGANANSLLGRFALLDNNIEEFCNKIKEKETFDNPEIIYAEVIFAPAKSVANITRRPNLSEFEIPIFADSASTATSILLSDIVIFLDKKNDIILKSKKQNKRIIPRLSNAHNFKDNSNSTYHFLAALQFQNQENLGVNLNAKKLKKRRIPRISYKNIILYRASWFLQEDDIKKIKTAGNPISELKHYFERWNVPKYIVLVKGDNELFIDTSNTSFLDVLLSEFKDSSLIHLAEWPNIPDTNTFSQQILLPLKNKILANENALLKSNESCIQRSFLPGSEWIYFKIYCSNTFSDELLSIEIKSLLDHLISDNIINNMFFIRYTDPHYHIRLRMYITDMKFFSYVIQKVYDILNPYFLNKSIWNIQLDSYHRELERYDANYILATEKAFFADSLLILKLLTKSNFFENESIRLFAAVKNVDSWLSLFNLSLNEKLNFTKAMENNFLKEFPTEFKTHIKSKYRDLSNELNTFLINNEFEKEFSIRNDRLNNLSLLQENLSSYIHMSLNRWFSSEQRALELMTYTFAMKNYSRIINQQKHII